MANLVIVGTQWGCQGKNKIVDSLVHDTYGGCVREIRAIESEHPWAKRTVAGV